MTSPRPTIAIDFEARFCANHVADVTAGCSFGCIYCPFSDIAARRRGVDRATPVDLDGLDRLPSPPSIFLSPASDPFAPQAAARTHALLRYLLPRGTVVGILTKGIIPEPTLDLLSRHADQIEGVVAGITSLDDHRNGVLERGCPPALARLQNVRAAVRRGFPAAVRLDPMFPGIDDREEDLASVLDMAAAAGARSITATYVFAWGRYLRRLRSEPLVAEACAVLTERAPMEGGIAFSVPLARKMETYSWLARAAHARGMAFNTCGCKDLRIAAHGDIITSCRNASFLEARGLEATRT